MCGICGVIGGVMERERPRVQAMMTALAHRGPDDADLHAEQDAVLGHRRLTIIDLNAGRQPLGSEDGSCWITFNGEIYNYRELRAELEADGNRFRTASDTEVLLRLYQRDGEACLARLRGMFAFAIWNSRTETLFAARDRFGQKPFFYAERGGRLMFASELKGLLAHSDIAAEPEPVAIDYYLGLRFVPPPLTMFRGVQKLPAGHCLTWQRGTLTVRPYWSLRFGDGPARSERDWIAELRERLDDAVRSHLVSDVPVGALLSGGLDSSLVTALMARHLEGAVPTFAIGSDQPTFDERPFAHRVAVHCGTHHRDLAVTANQLASIPRLVACLDEPSDPIAACFYESSALASQHVKVVLGGDGGDELFAGFDRYVGFRWAGWYRALPGPLRRVVAAAAGRLPDSFAYKGPVQKLRWLATVAEEQGGRRYARMTTFFRFGSDEKQWLYGPALAALLDSCDAEQAILRPFDSLAGEPVLRRMGFTDIVTKLPEHTLMLTDRLSMAHGLETRSPLLDHELAEFCATMPPELHAQGGVTKYALRKAASGLLPPGIIRRPKQGFMFPVAYWLTDQSVPEIRRRLVRGPAVQNGWIRAEAVDRLCVEHLAHRADHHVRIWMLLNLDAWYRIYLEGDAADSSRVTDEATASLT
ncbi:MAG TPA: asparagine synthase (glutamine-hydrolyzing) [Gemmatimonadales bacterium]|nr:asparagine synthase (glutamine-hydrolyzing) [Gemmatimonadales bacterium]